jgi:hypothetical protein
MPASPRDFALWSSMTGNPYPQSDAERAALAPHVYQYVNNIGRRGGVRGFIDAAGKTALAAGAIAGAVALSRTPEGQEIIENVAQTVEPHLQNAKTTISNALGRGVEGSLYEKARPGAQSFLGGFKEGAMRQLQPVIPPSAVVIEDPEQTVEARRPITYGKGSTPVDTGRVTWGRGGMSAQPAQASIPDPWQERPRGVVVTDLLRTSKQGPSGRAVTDLLIVPKQGMGNMPYEMPENIEPGPGLEEQLATIDYENKAAAYRKSQQYAEMAARHPSLQNIGTNEELIGGATGTSEVLPQESPDVVMDVINRYAPDYQRAKNAQYGREAQGELRRQTAYAGSIESKIDDLLADIRGENPQPHETTAGRYNQDVIPAQMRLVQEAKGAPPGAPARRLLQNEPITQAGILSTQQTMGPEAPMVTGPSSQEISDMDTLLLRSHGHLPPPHRAALRDQLLAQKYNTQPEASPSPQVSDAGSMVNAPVAVVATNPVAKANQWRQSRVRAGSGENARVGRLASYGYDPYEPVEETNVMQGAPGSRQALLAEQLQRDAMRQAEMQGHYDYIAKQRQAVPTAPYNPQDFRPFIKPASTWIGG